MNFNSLEFIFFLIIVLFLYWIIPHKTRWVLLLVASYIFYMSWNVALIFLIVATTLISYGAGIAISKTDKKNVKKFWLIATLIVCLGALFFFKYFDFLLGSIIDLLNCFSLNLNSFSLNLLLPIGISFYTFQTLSYVIDVYRGTVKAETHLGYYALFVCYFPQLVAGPIERPGDLIPQLKAEHTFNKEQFNTGFRILLVGFFYKCVIADFTGVFVTNVFNSAQSSNALAVLIAGLLFGVQMYCDFAGYSEIATGAALMMGVKLTRNFNRPYMATSYSDFFRRWHITLTRWFTDYLYIPLGGNRKGKARKILNLVIVFILCGLWHGANWTYVVWGAYVSVIMILENAFSKPINNFFEKRGIDLKSKSALAIQRFLMHLVHAPACIIFRASSLGQASVLLTNLFTNWGFGENYFNQAMSSLGLNSLFIIQVLLCVICYVSIFHFGEIGRENQPQPLNTMKTAIPYEFHRFSAVVYIILLVAICWLATVSLQDSSAFLYFQF